MPGATPTIFPFSVDYSKFILLGTPIMLCSFVLNNILRSEGKATLATLLSLFIGCCILFGCFFINKTTIRLHPKKISRHKDIYVSILTTGCPSFCRQGLASVSYCCP
ncbi:MATE family efflux transporter [Lachnospiraceae bacterium LCP25S3_G4]